MKESLVFFANDVFEGEGVQPIKCDWVAAIVELRREFLKATLGCVLLGECLCIGLDRDSVVDFLEVWMQEFRALAALVREDDALGWPIGELRVGNLV
nr:hypothetical protein [Halomicrobium sp. LC1Hm]